MKLRVTFDITDEQRLVIGMIVHGKLTTATRDEMTEMIETQIDKYLEQGVGLLRESNRAVVEQLSR